MSLSEEGGPKCPETLCDRLHEIVVEDIKECSGLELHGAVSDLER